MLASLAATRAWETKTASAAQSYYTLRLLDGTIYGPGGMPDSPMPGGVLEHIQFEAALHGSTEFFNNGSAPPNIASEGALKKPLEGRTSTGVAFNEYLDGGAVDVGGGAIRYLSVVIEGGLLAGRQLYYLDQAHDWRIESNMVLDPGFPEGLIAPQDLVITTGLVRLPSSLQTKQGMLGGVDRAGSLRVGAPLIGRLGDFDADGYLDGAVVGVANVPLGHLFSPGCPVAQSRMFTSDIPISPYDAAFLTLASLHNFAQVWGLVVDHDISDEWLRTNRTSGAIATFFPDIAARLDTARRLLRRVSEKEEQGDSARSAAARLSDLLKLWSDAKLSSATLVEAPAHSAPARRAIETLFGEAARISSDLARRSGLPGA